MEGPGHLRRLALFLIVPFTGCTYAGARFRDFGDIFRLEGKFGLGLQVDTQVGELVHLGVGSSRHTSAGWVYGRFDSQWQIEDHFPLSLIYAFIEPDKETLHSVNLETDTERRSIAQHRCYVLFPGGWEEGDVRKPDIRYFDIEVGALALVLGFKIGFSFGEFLDFLLGFFTIDIADDDHPAERERRTLWIWEGRSRALIRP